jgi:hypothetical protein
MKVKHRCAQAPARVGGKRLGERGLIGVKSDLDTTLHYSVCPSPTSPMPHGSGENYK